MSHPRPPSDEAQTVQARRVLEALAQRTTLDEAIGVLRCWWQCSATQARSELEARYDRRSGDAPGGSPDMTAEVTRVVAVVNAAADRCADPDLDGW